MSNQHQFIDYIIFYVHVGNNFTIDNFSLLACFMLLPMFQGWDYHLLRNRSIIVDLFHGQLKSLVRCKTCSHTSVRFDPFTYLSLPLPMENSLLIEVIGK